MIRQPKWGTRDVNRQYYKNEATMISLFNEVFANVELSSEENQTFVWLAGCSESTVRNVVSAIQKAIIEGI